MTPEIEKRLEEIAVESVFYRNAAAFQQRNIMEAIKAAYHLGQQYSEAKWISVGERLPEHSVMVRAIRTYGNGKMEEIHTVYVERIQCFDDLLCDIITHWQYIILPKTIKYEN